MLLKTISPKTWSLWVGTLCIFVNAVFAQAQIIEDGSIESADAQSLLQEIELFTTIQQGISLSVTECELLDACNASVNRSEVEQLISTIDNRVNALSLRYTETGDTGLESILVGYVDVRDNYKLILEKMASIPVFAQQESAAVGFDGDDFFTGATNSGSVSDDLMQLFQDADDELVDDALEDVPATEENSQ